MMRTWLMLLSIAVFLVWMPAWASAAGRKATEEATCLIIEDAARANQLPVATLTRLLWYESRFEIGAVSRAGALGVAQFMPATANELGLSDPFDLDEAIPQAASFLADLDRQFGNIGLAIAAYNAGPGRITEWLDRAGALPGETSRFVLAVTGHTAQEWEAFGPYLPLSPSAGSQSCIELRAVLGGARFSNIDLDPDRFRPELRQSGRLLQGLEKSGRLLPGVGRSGRLLTGIEQRGTGHP